MLTADDIRGAVGGKFFRVVFTKRTDGSVREMHCRLGVTKHTNGEGARYSFQSKGLLSVYDLGKKGYRAVPLEGITELRCGRIKLKKDGTLGLQKRREKKHGRSSVGRVRRDRIPQGRDAVLEG